MTTFLVTTIISSSTAVEVKCDYSISSNFIVFDRVLTCTVNFISEVDNKNITAQANSTTVDNSTQTIAASNNNENVTRVVNENPSLGGVNYSLADVKHLIINNQSFQYLPSGFGTLFPKLEGLQVTGTQLGKLTHDNLKDFKYLRYLDASNNNITR